MGRREGEASVSGALGCIRWDRILNMSEQRDKQAAAALWALRNAGETIDSLPLHCKPINDDEGRRSQLFFSELANDAVAGWKIAASSVGGQKHIGVTEPLEGPYLASHIHRNGAILSMAGNHMAVAEAEFAFCFSRNLESRSDSYTTEEILDAVGSLHPSLEFPDSRISDFANAGAAALLADCACGRDWVIGDAANADWRNADLSRAPTKLIINDEIATEGSGADALGNPLRALEWVVNRLSERKIAVQAGQFITTGVCGLPKPVQSGDHVVCDLGDYGTVSAVLVD